MNAPWPAIDFGHTGARRGIRSRRCLRVAPDPARADEAPAPHRHRRMRRRRAGKVDSGDPAPPDHGRAGRLRRRSPTRKPTWRPRRRASPARCPQPTSAATARREAQPDLRPGAGCGRRPCRVARAGDRGRVFLAWSRSRSPPIHAEAAALVARGGGSAAFCSPTSPTSASRHPMRWPRRWSPTGALKAAPTVFTGKFTLGYPYVDLLEGGTVHLLDLVLWFMGPVRAGPRARRSCAAAGSTARSSPSPSDPERSAR